MVYPTAVWDGDTENRDPGQRKSPNWQDWGVLVQEIAGTQTELDNVKAGSVDLTDLVVDKTGMVQVGEFAAGAATTAALNFSETMDVNGDNYLSVVQAYGAAAADLTSAYNCTVGRFRHVLYAAAGITVAQETYGVTGQVVARKSTLTHLHAGVLGTFEAHTELVTLNSSYTYGHAGVMSRVGGAASITATTPVCGFLAFWNSAAALASGRSVAFAADCVGDTYKWDVGLELPVGSVVKGIRIGAFAGSAAVTSAIPFTTSLDTYADGQLDITEAHGASAADLTSAYSAKVARFRHIVNVGTGDLAHETYGAVGQVVVKDTTLKHLHAGLMGTFEGHTSGVVVDGSYFYGAAAVLARVGGGAAITATKDIAGVLAFWNGAALASGLSSAFAVGDEGTAPWTNAIGIERCTNLLDLPAAGTDPVIANALVPATAPDGSTVGADACLRVLVNNVAYYIPLYDTLHA